MVSPFMNLLPYFKKIRQASSLPEIVTCGVVYLCTFCCLRRANTEKGLFFDDSSKQVRA
jgi:hypothetical protein